MPRIILNKLGPIKYCDLEVKDFMVFTGPQASGKSTIAKSIFFFRNIKNILITQVRKRYLINTAVFEENVKNQFIKDIRSNFLQIFGSTWCMDIDMSIEYKYTEEVCIKISLKEDQHYTNYIWVEFSPKLRKYLDQLFLEICEDVNASMNVTKETLEQRETGIIDLFADDSEIIYIPAGRSMMTLLSTQLNYIYGSMDDIEKRNLDFCTQNYLERILKLKPNFSVGLEEMIKDKKERTDLRMNEDVLNLCIELINEILHGEYRNINGEERLQVSRERYVKINFASSGQQECLWILNVLFYYIINNKKAYFIIEEPESHLFPNAQKLMAEFISISKVNGNQVLITTHSPYILGTINNLLYANKISKVVNLEKISQIIEPHAWLKFEKLSAYYLKEGYIRSCVDDEFEAIQNEVIDGASDCINNDYDAMLQLKEEIREEGKMNVTHS